jgi:hypothetical protein
MRPQVALSAKHHTKSVQNICCDRGHDVVSYNIMASISGDKSPRTQQIFCTDFV